MKKLGFSIGSLLLSFSIAAQAPQINWTKAIYGATPSTPLEAFITDLDTDAEGNTYLTGEFKGEINFGNITLTGTGNDATLFLAKYSTDGTPQWAKKAVPQIAQTASPFAASSKIDVDSVGNVYWCGNFQATTLNFGDGLIYTSTCTNNCKEGFLVKINASGTFQFAKSLHAAEGEAFNVAGIVASAQGKHYVTGTFKGSELWLQGGANIGGITTEGFFLVQYTAAGNAEWVLFVPENSGDPISEAIAISPDGQRIVVTGTYDGPSLDFGNSATTSSTANRKVFAAWFNTLGQPIGAGTLGAETIDVLDIRVDYNNRLWAACNFTGELRWNEQYITQNTGTSQGGALAVVAPGILPQSAANVGYNGNSYPLITLALGKNETFYAGGYAAENLTINGAGNLTNKGCTDVLLLQGANNQVEWASSIGGTGCEVIDNYRNGSLMETDAAGRLHLGGQFTESAKFGTTTFNGNGLWIGMLTFGTVATAEAGTDLLQITPNPASDVMRLEGNFPENSTVELWSIDGKLALRQSILQSMPTFQVSDLQSGLYVVKVIAENTPIMISKVLIYR